MKNFFYVQSILLLLLNSNLLHAQTTKFLVGKIYNIEGYSLNNASVIVKEADKIVGYAITKNSGTYVINFIYNTKSRYYLEVSHIAYQTFRKEIIFSVNNDSIVIDVKLLKIINDLPNVTIKNNKFIIAKSKDTLEYNVKRFNAQPQSKLEDLLRMISDFRVYDDGTITFKGKEIKKILIEGEDLTGSNYTLLSKNLNSNLVEKIQVIQNFNENRLENEIIKSNELALNLKVQNNNKISGGVTYGNSLTGRFLLDNNLLMIKKKIKSLLFLNSNNVARIFMHKQINEDVDEVGFKKITDEVPIELTELQKPSIRTEYLNNNNDFGVNFSNAISVNNNVRIKLQSTFLTEKNALNNESYDNILLPDTNWITKTIEAKKDNNNTFFNKLTIVHDNGGNNVGSFNFSVNANKSIFNYNNQTSISFLDDRAEKLNLNTLKLNINGYESFKLKKGKVLTFLSSVNYKQDNLSYALKTDRLKFFFNSNNVLNNNLQQTSYNFFNSNLATRIVGRLSNKITYSYGIHFVNTNLIAYNKINLITSNYIDTNILNSKQRYLEYKQGIFSNFNYTANRKLNINTSVYLGLGANSLQWSKTNYFLLPKVYVALSYMLSSSNELNFNYKYVNDFTSLNTYFNDTTLSGGNNIKFGNKDIRPSTLSEFNFSYNTSNIIKNSAFSIRAHFSKQNRLYTTEAILNPVITILQFRSFDNNYTFFVNTNLSQYLNFIKSKLTYRLDIRNTRTNIFLNNLPLSIFSTTLTNEFNLVSGFEGKLNFEATYNVFIQKNKNDNFINKPVFLSNTLSSASFKLKYNFTNKLYSNFLINQYYYSANKFTSADFFASGRLKRNLSLSLTVHNIFNQHFFVQEFVQTNSITTNSFAVVTRYLLLRCNVSF